MDRLAPYFPGAAAALDHAARRCPVATSPLDGAAALEARLAAALSVPRRRRGGSAGRGLRHRGAGDARRGAEARRTSARSSAAASASASSSGCATANGPGPPTTCSAAHQARAAARAGPGRAGRGIPARRPGRGRGRRRGEVGPGHAARHRCLRRAGFRPARAGPGPSPERWRGRRRAGGAAAARCAGSGAPASRRWRRAPRRAATAVRVAAWQEKEGGSGLKAPTKRLLHQAPPPVWGCRVRAASRLNGLRPRLRRP